MRCPECNKFVSFADEGDVSNVEVELNGTDLDVTGEVMLQCGECGTDIAQGDVSDSINIDVLEVENADTKEDEEPDEFELVSSEVEYHEHTQDKDRSGKPIKLARYRKVFKGVRITGVAKRIRDGQEFYIDVVSRIQASDFEEC